MQYILTQTEYDELRSKKKQSIDLDKERLQALCTKIANEMPVGRYRDGTSPKPWGCVIKEDNLNDYVDWCCDECPVQTICPYPYKEYSK